MKARLRQRHRVRIRPGPGEIALFSWILCLVSGRIVIVARVSVGRPSAFVAGNKSLGSTSRPKTSPFPRASSGGRLILSKLPKTAVSSVSDL